MTAHVLFTGLGAGNIGDEAMFQGFLSIYPLPTGSSIEVWDSTADVLNQFPSYYHYVNFRDQDLCSERYLDSSCVLLVGGTPVMEKWGLEWPLRNLSFKLENCHRNRVPCNAVGVGVDRLETQEAEWLFRKGFLPIKSWTVRSVRSRNNLIALGVDPFRIKVGADLAWLLPCSGINRKWATTYLRELGVKGKLPIMGVNIVNELWKDNIGLKREVAGALDHVTTHFGFNIVFFCNETREGVYFDKEAAFQVASLMKSRPLIVPNKYFTPQEMIALLSCCKVTLSWRYHFTLLSLLAGAVSISVIRGEKMQELVEDLGLEHVGDFDRINREKIVEKIKDVFRQLDSLRAKQETIIDVIKHRSKLNLSFLNSIKRHFRKEQIMPANAMASVEQLKSERFQAFVDTLNVFSRSLELRQFTNWSKIWEYPWVWFHGLSKVDWKDFPLLDIGSELSPMPWFLASLGANVTLVETDPQWVPQWERICDETGFDVKWQIVSGEKLPFEDESFDVVTSFSVIEHQKDKRMAVNEMVRVLKPGGLFAISFDVCESELGMTFPDWNGRALTMAQFEELVWNHPGFDTEGQAAEWNLRDIPEFIRWHLQSAPHHNYVVGASVLRKREI